MHTKESFSGLPIFMISMSRWDGDISSASLALAKVFSRNNPVYYIDYPYTMADVFRERKLPSVQMRLDALLKGKNYLRFIPGQPENLMAATPMATLPINSLPPGKIYDIATHINNKILAKLIRRICREKNYDSYIFINSFNPIYLQQIEKYLQPAWSVYHSRDAIEEISSHGLYRENTCVKHYDMSMATSITLCKNISERNQKEVHYFPNGGDISLFRTAIEKKLPKPKELEGITTPIIGYTGAICQRIDYELLLALSKRHADKTIVLVGPRRDKQFSPYDLEALPNVVLTGPKKIDELPAYLQYFDCAILPFVYSKLTAGIYPLKINEYLGAGCSVVSTAFSEDVKGFSNSIRLAETQEAFLNGIDAAIADQSEAKKQERLEVASSNAWENRVARFWELAWNQYQLKNQ